jgi:hypothetical protein
LFSVNVKSVLNNFCLIIFALNQLASTAIADAIYRRFFIDYVEWTLAIAA